MTGYKRVNYYELCRLCTSSQPKDKIHIFRDDGKKMQLQQKIQSCFPLLVCEHDYLPKVVCSTCVEALDQCYNFRQNCINSETMLSSYFSNFRFTDDFKKAGKVYVKDTGQIKLETLNQNITTSKKVVQENLVSSPILQENNQYFLDLPGHKTYTKISSSVSPIHSSPHQNGASQNLSSLQNSLPLQNPSQNQNNASLQNTIPLQKLPNNEYILKTAPNFKSNELQTNTCQQNIQLPTSNTSLSTQHLNFNSLNAKQIEIQNSDLIKGNNLQPQALMYIDIDQLIDAGLPEQEINKLKDVLLKPVEFTKKEIPPTNDEININNNNNNNNLKTNDEVIKVFKCETCEKIFKRREHLYQHSKLHTGLRPFSCLHCPKTFSRKEHLLRHLTSHSGAKDFPCDICSKKFSRPDNLKKHKKTHQKSGPFICEVCSKSFVIKHYYLAHKLQHDDGSIKN